MNPPGFAARSCLSTPGGLLGHRRPGERVQPEQQDWAWPEVRQRLTVLDRDMLGRQRH